MPVGHELHPAFGKQLQNPYQCKVMFVPLLGCWKVRIAPKFSFLANEHAMIILKVNSILASCGFLEKTRFPLERKVLFGSNNL